MMASFLSAFGFIHFVGDSVIGSVQGLSWKIGFPILFLIYFYSHYLFASNTAHIAAMYPIFLTVSISLGANPMFAALALALLVIYSEDSHTTDLVQLRYTLDPISSPCKNGGALALFLA